MLALLDSCANWLIKMKWNNGTVSLVSVYRKSNILKRLRVPSLFSVIAAALLAFATVQLVRLIWTVATPLDPVGDWRPASPEIMSADARSALFAGFDPFFRTQIQAVDAEAITSLALTLFGIRSNQASGAGSAIIADSAGVQNSYAVGEDILPGVSLFSVAFDHVIISNNGVQEKLYLDQSVPAETVGGAADSSVTSKSAPQPADAKAGVVVNPENLAKSVGLAPRNENGKVTGLVVSAKDDGSILNAAGLRAGDIIVSVNGAPVSSAADLAGQFRPGARIAVEVERGAQKMPVAIILEK
jgi:general secretion pathway protein C